MEEYNHKILLIVLKHFFCDIETLHGSENILKYYFKFIEEISNNADISWNELNDYLIWEPFENYYPSQVLSLMEDMYFEIFETLNLQSPNIVINPLELASDLAEKEVDLIFKNSNTPYKKIKDKEISYTAVASTLFTSCFSDYSDIIMACDVNKN